MPLLLIMQISPKISIAPLFILWFGLGLTSKIALVILVVPFPIMVAESSALKKINSGYRDLMNILQANRWQIFIRMELPCAFHNEIRMWYNPDLMENRQRAVFMAGCEVLDPHALTFSYRLNN